ncbi:protein hunchback [Drosophila rhopaloa]|uniref:Protein hunchback n=1 Tax=Drosophila rhopaloa TaxID=1041015 RepID=A0A6P4FL32_DRORH|nr:protein hunchback [Drosophila rhopaloa]
MLASASVRLALFAVISSQTLQLQAAPFPGIENAAFTSQDLLAEESAPVQHNRHRRHHGDGNYHEHHHHKRHWDHHFPGPDCHHHHHEGFGFEHPPHGPPTYGPPPHRFEPHGFEPFPNTFGAPEYEEHQRPFKAELEPFKEDNAGSRSQETPRQPGPNSVAPPPAAPTTPTPTSTTTTSTTSSTTTSTTAAPISSTTTEEPALAIDIRIG